MTSSNATTRAAESPAPSPANAPEPLDSGCRAALDPTGCLTITVKLDDVSPRSQYDVGLSVYGPDTPSLGGIRRAARRPAMGPATDVSEHVTNEFRLGSVRTDGNGKGR